MIETLEDYQRIMRSTHNMIAGSIDLEATFMALLAVARAAQKIYDVEGDYVGDCTCTSCKKINEDLEGALDALPQWVLDTEDNRD